jgi:hypothetical protein
MRLSLSASRLGGSTVFGLAESPAWDVDVQ